LNCSRRHQHTNRPVPDFAFCGLPRGGWPHVDEREDVFCRLARDSGHPCSVLRSLSGERWPTANWDMEMERIADFLRELPKPVAVLAYIDERGYHVLDACRHAGLVVPDQVVVLGTGNDAVLCEMASPSLSSIDLDAPRMGYTAAACLDQLMNGGRPLRSQRIVQPLGVVARRSTDMLATNDADLSAALRFIRDHACDGIRLDDVLRQVAISQTTLERKFRSFLGRMPKAELLRVQMARAGALLADSDLPIKEVAQRCGFHNETYFSSAFYRQYGAWPTAHRRRYRSGGDSA
jgi:LacI family transcriptional regulator